MLIPEKFQANGDKLVILSGRFLSALPWNLKQLSKPFVVEDSEHRGREVWRDDLEESRVTMTLSEHLSVHLPLA